jgi:DNA-3-methyladenine glycosylase
MNPLPASFYDHDVLDVAPSLLGARLVRVVDGVRISGIIVETEAYRGQEDQANHARRGLTPRTRVMFGPAGVAYVYFTYGMHWMLNAVTGPEGYPAAVLIRAVQPLEGLERIAANRPGVASEHWTDGPAKLCRAFEIDRHFNGLPLTTPEHGLWIEAGPPPDEILTGPRVGLGTTPEPWLSQPWRLISLAKPRSTQR